MGVVSWVLSAALLHVAISFTLEEVQIKGVTYYKFVPEATEPDWFKGDLFLPGAKVYFYTRLSLMAGAKPRTFGIMQQPIQVIGAMHLGKVAQVKEVHSRGPVSEYPAGYPPELLQMLKKLDMIDGVVPPIFNPFAFDFDLDPHPPSVPAAEPGHCYMNAAITVANALVGFNDWDKKKWKSMAAQLEKVTKKKYQRDGWTQEWIQLMLRTKGLNFAVNAHPRSRSIKSETADELKYQFQRGNWRAYRDKNSPGWKFNDVEHFKNLLKGKVTFRTNNGKDWKNQEPMAAMILAVSTQPDFTQAMATKAKLVWPTPNHATVVVKYPRAEGHYWYIDTNQQGILKLLPSGKPNIQYVENKDSKKFQVDMIQRMASLTRSYKVEQSADLGGNGEIVAKWLLNKCEIQTVHGKCGALFYYVVIRDPQAKIADWDEFVASQQKIVSYPLDMTIIGTLVGSIEVMFVCTCCFIGLLFGYFVHWLKDKYVLTRCSKECACNEVKVDYMKAIEPIKK